MVRYGTILYISYHICTIHTLGRTHQTTSITKYGTITRPSSNATLVEWLVSHIILLYHTVITPLPT